MPKPTHRFKRATHRTGQYTWNGSIEVRYQRRLNGERSTVQKAVEIEIEMNGELPRSTSRWAVGVMGLRAEADAWGEAGTPDPMDVLVHLEHWYWTFAEAKEAAIAIIENGLDRSVY